MKKFAILSVILLYVVVGQLNAQDSKNYAITGSKKELRVEKRSVNVEKRSIKKNERKELRVLKGNKVGIVSMKSFKTDFSDATDVIWNRTPNYDIAAFTLDDRAYRAYYDADGQLVGTTTLKTFKELPKRGQKAILTKYKDYQVGQIIYFDNNIVNRSPMILFGSEIVDASSYFVELNKGAKKMIVYVDIEGNVSPFKVL